MHAPSPRSVGQIALQHGLITQAMLDHALAIQQQSGERLGHILLSEGYTTPLKLYPVVAAHYELPFVNLHDSPADVTLQDTAQLPEYIRLQAIPHARADDDTTVIATSNLRPKLSAWATRHYGAKHRFVITSPLDIYWHIDHHFADALDNQSRNKLWALMPEKSAKRVLAPHQKQQLAAVALVFCALLLWLPHQTTLYFLLLVNAFYFFTILLKCQLFVIGSRYRPGKTIPAKTLTALDDKSLPVYTVLIPLHDEAETIPRLIKGMDALEYPKAKLDIKLIVERDDLSTIEAIKAQRPHSGYEIIYVPYSLPQTKPKACNYALHFARGEYVTIYDAEDIPDPQQLKKAVYWFRQRPERFICLQARLNYYNREHSLLTRLFAIEYAAWFDFMLPGLRQLDIPIPLGGTSNHIHLQKLREVGEWDPYNVTEDADLGIRLALAGYETDTLDSLTAEEAPIQLDAWIKQRTRWIRGYMQTWLVHMRHPLHLMRRMPATAFWGFQFFVGGPCLVFLTAPLLWVLCGLWMLDWLQVDDPILSPWIRGFAAWNLLFGLTAHLVFALVIIGRYRWRGMLPALCAFPLYWLLHSWASFKALWQLATNPHIWEKTPHGLSSVTAEEHEDVLRHMR